MTKKQNSEKVTYEIDPYNRLIIKKTGKKSNLSRFRQAFDGRFKIDKNNNIIYSVKSPMPKGEVIPHQVKLKGKWSLSKDHNLCLSLDKLGRNTLGDKLTLQADIIDTTKNSLVFAVTTRTKENTQFIYTLKLQGAWQADKHNRLTFKVQRERGRHDILTFKGAWEVDRNHQIVYRYEKAQLIRKQKKLHTLTFKGHWNIKGKGRLFYVLDRRADAGFDFKTSVGVFKDKYIKYEISIGTAKKWKLTLSGKWRIKKGVGLLFEVKYKDKKPYAIIFGAEAKLTARDSISFKLKNELNKDISAQVQLSRKMLKGDGLSFLRFLKSKDKTAVTVGAGLRW
ncbi:MAG: hypothetical protein GY853_00100 [PVC group bacterium]|nr:hypothetical protein [PVC group bacterium]